MNENKILKELYEFILEKTDKKTFQLKGWYLSIYVDITYSTAK